jgi:hypothetical protein
MAVLNAFCTGGSLEAAADAVLGIGPTPATLAAVSQLPLGALLAGGDQGAAAAADGAPRSPAGLPAAGGGPAAGCEVAYLGQQPPRACAPGVPWGGWYTCALPGRYAGIVTGRRGDDDEGRRGRAALDGGCSVIPSPHSHS